MIGYLLCLVGWHRWNYGGNAHTQAPAPIRCERCCRPYGHRRSQ